MLAAFTALMIMIIPLQPATDQTPPPPAYPPDVVADMVIDSMLSYVEAVQAQEYLVWLRDQIAQEAAQRAAEEAYRASQQHAVTAPQASPVTGVCGGATNGADQFISRESGGNPSVYNTGGSGAWGCYQIMPGTWAGAGCNELGAHGSASPAAQAACASRLPLSAWNLY